MTLVTLARLRRFMPGGKLDLLRAMADNVRLLDRYAIDTPLRVAHFLGQCAVESWYFTTMVERGSTAQYKGRGYIQLTGRRNYAYYGSLVGLDLVAQPERAAEPDLAVRLACLFWDRNRLNRYADANDPKKVSRAINRGDPDDPELANNEGERIQYTNLARRVFLDGPDRFDPASSGPAIEALRHDLTLIGFPLDLPTALYDGETEAAIRSFQDQLALPVTGIADELTLDALARAAAQHEARDQESALPPVAVALTSALTGAAAGYVIGRGLARDKFRSRAQPLRDRLVERPVEDELYLGCEDDVDARVEPEVMLDAAPERPKPVPAGAPVLFARSDLRPQDRHWPVLTSQPSRLVVSYETVSGGIRGRPGRRFLADRRGGRYHVGIDLFAREHDTVVACEAGRIVNFYPFYESNAGEITHALLIEHDGFVVNYGEVKGDARTRFGWQIGNRVQAGQEIATVSSTDMLHLETYETGTRRNRQWYQSGARPRELLNPTLYLLEIAGQGAFLGAGH